ncbi:PREDICTED: FBD-associated F-box protein At3g52670-like [Camelina sativa]|uniref:FBD-associated F-box protein At3g52670-like n=1 Tax=Camelina sativa TaxID=90675 RepID=A0ABM0TTT5_CAMSA|nr:PREDICTED: FBD-associated F-box protein At3g52670-like [Camelina sativa]
MRNRGVMNEEDRLTQLPEDLILRVLSLLPTKTAITTSVLSKQWRSLWKFVPNLKFDSEDHKSQDQTFSEGVSRSILSHKATVLESLRLKFSSDNVSPVDIGLWVGIAFTRHLRKLVLYVYYPSHETFSFPASLCTCNTLETLKLSLGIIVDLLSPVLMKSLRTLHLEFVSYKDDESFRNLLSGCPVLENLVLDRGEYYDDVVTFVIEVPSLKRLEIYDYNCDERFEGYRINVSSLEYLTFQELTFQELTDFEISLNAPELVEVYIIGGSYIIADKFLGSLKSAKRVSFDLLPLQIVCPTSSIFYQLVSLEMHTRKQEWWNVLTVMLEISPKLQVLRLLDYRNKDDDMVGGKWNEPKYVPECLLSHLETFVWEKYAWDRQEEQEVATYILRYAKQLKKATISTNPINSKKLKKLEERRKMLKELASVVRASSSCHLVYEFE